MELTRATPRLLKHLNERTVLEAIRARAPISRAEISRRAGISKPTVSLALRSLLEAGLVREALQDPAGPSYGAVFFEPVPDAAFVLGLDLGAQFLRGAVCDLAGEIRVRQDVELRGADAEGALEAMVTLHESLVSASGLPAERIDGVVVGVPGVVDHRSGTLRLATNVPGLEGRPYGGELHRGHNGAAGEVDYALGGIGDEIDPSAAGVAALAERLAAERSDGTALTAPYEPRATFAAARSGDKVAAAVVEETAHRIAAHIAPIAAVADVALVVLGGGIGTNSDLLLRPVRALLES